MRSSIGNHEASVTRIFTAALATEINTFSPLPVDLESFREGLLAHPGEHPERPTLATGPMVAARRHAKPPAGR
jgi:microcystin degradation protein MlrC